MMIKPSISELSKKVDSRYTLVIMTAKRSRMLGTSQNANENEDTKVISKAVEEIADGRIQYCRGEENFNGALISENGEMIYSGSEPSADLNLEALKYELEAAERRANEERMEKERLEKKVMEAQGISSEE